MLLKISLEAQRRIFQSQLSALLHKEIDFVTAVAQIEAKAESPLKERIGRARAQSSDTATLIDGLVAQELFSPEMSAIARAAAPLKIDAENYLRKHLKNETESNKIQAAIMGPINSVVWTFILMFLFFLSSFSIYRTFILPRLQSPEFDSIMPASRFSLYVLLISFILLGIYSAFLFCMYLGLNYNRAESWKKLRFLWSVPWINRLYRKRITWRIFTNCQILVNAGVDQATAMETSLHACGLKTRTEGSALHFPSSTLLDPASVGAANLGSSLDTFEAQLSTAVGLLEQELPYTAQSTARAIYYVGYLVMGVMVCAMLIQMYEPIFRLAMNIE